MHMWCLWGSWMPKLSKPGKHWHSTCQLSSVIIISRLRILTAWKWIGLINIIKLNLWLKHFNKTCSCKWLQNRLKKKKKIMISLPHTLTNYEISSWSVLLVPNKHSCMLIYSTVLKAFWYNTLLLGLSSYTIIWVNTVRHIHECATLHPCLGLHC